MAYKEKHGHCNVKQNDPKNKSLGTWVKDQRTFYKKWTNGEKSQLTQERISMLERIGFNWGKTRAPRVSWKTHFEEYKEYLETFVSDKNLVHTDYNKCSALGKWATWQRSKYKAKMMGRSVGKPLTKERINLLNGIGFDWDGPIAASRSKK